MPITKQQLQLIIFPSQGALQPYAASMPALTAMTSHFAMSLKTKTPRIGRLLASQRFWVLMYDWFLVYLFFTFSLLFLLQFLLSHSPSPFRHHQTQHMYERWYFQAHCQRQIAGKLEQRMAESYENTDAQTEAKMTPPSAVVSLCLLSAAFKSPP